MLNEHMHNLCASEYDDETIDQILCKWQASESLRESIFEKQWPSIVDFVSQSMPYLNLSLTGMVCAMLNYWQKLVKRVHSHETTLYVISTLKSR